MKNILIISSILISNLCFSQNKSEQIKEIISLSKINSFTPELKNQLLDLFKKNYPSVDENFWNKAESQIDINVLMISISSLYDKYYTNKEIDELLKFYKSPLGKKMIQNSPLILKESQSIGANWAIEVERKIKNDLIKEGYLSPSTSNSNYLPPPPPANKNNPR